MLQVRIDILHLSFSNTSLIFCLFRFDSKLFKYCFIGSGSDTGNKETHTKGDSSAIQLAFGGMFILIQVK